MVQLVSSLQITVKFQIDFFPILVHVQALRQQFKTKNYLKTSLKKTQGERFILIFKHKLNKFEKHKLNKLEKHKLNIQNYCLNVQTKI